MRTIIFKGLAKLAFLLFLPTVLTAQSEPFGITFAIWQDPIVSGHEYPETVGPVVDIAGGNGTVWEGSIGSPTSWWQKVPSEHVDFSRASDYNRIGIVLWNKSPFCIPMGKDWSPSGCPEYADNFFPMVAKVTVTARASNGTTTIVFDELINWDWRPPQDYGGYGFYWWHRTISGYNIVEYGDMPTDNWRAPNDYYNGEFFLRFEIISQPGSSGPVINPPNYSINYYNERTNQVVSSEDQYSYDNFGGGPVYTGSNQYLSLQPGQNVYFRKVADNTKRQTLTVPSRPSPPTFSVDYVNEQTLETVTSAYQYASSSDMSGATSGSGDNVNLTPGQNSYFRQISTPSSFRSQVQELLVPGRPAAPSFGVNYMNEQTSTAVSSEFAYSVNSNMSEATNGTGSAVDITPGTNLYFQKKAIQGAAFRSQVQTLTVSQRPAGPSMGIDYENERTESVLGSDMEYANNSEMTGAQSGTGDYLDVVPGQNLYLRTIATSSSFSSQLTQLVLPARPEMPGFSIDFAGEQTAEIVSDVFRYSLNSDMSNSQNGTGVKLPVFPQEKVYIQKRASATDFASEIQELDVPARPVAPVVEVDYDTERTAGQIDNLMEYSTSESMHDATSGNGDYVSLDPGTDLYLRHKASANNFASEIFHLDIPSRPIVLSSVSESTDLYPIPVSFEFFQLAIGLSDAGFELENAVIDDISVNEFGDDFTSFDANVYPTEKNRLVKVRVKANAVEAGNFESDAFEVIYTGTVSSSKHDLLSESLEVYPNPSEGMINLQYTYEGAAVPATLTIHSISGKIVYSHNEPLFNGTLSIDLHELPKGLYMLNLSMKRHTIVRKLILH